MSQPDETSVAERDRGEMAMAVLCAPGTGYDLTQEGQLPQLDRAIRAALEQCIGGTSWADHLLLAAVILAAHQWAAWQILATLCFLHGHLLAVFRAGGFSEIGEWDVQSQYDEDLWSNRWTGRERERRVSFWEQYEDVVYELCKWFAALPLSERQFYQPLLLPTLTLRHQAVPSKQAMR